MIVFNRFKVFGDGHHCITIGIADEQGVDAIRCRLQSLPQAQDWSLGAGKPFGGQFSSKKLGDSENELRG